MDTPKYAPFESLELERGELLAHTGTGATFHRSFDYAVAATDRALYVFTHYFLRSNRWQRFRYSDIEYVKVSTLPSRKGYVLALSTCFFLAVVGAQVLAQHYLGAALCAAFILWVSRESLNGMRDRTQLEIAAGSASHRFASPADPYEDEKPYDRRLFEVLAREAAKHGVRVQIGGGET